MDEALRAKNDLNVQHYASLRYGDKRKWEGLSMSSKKRMYYSRKKTYKPNVRASTLFAIIVGRRGI